jgi:hypothetical protein
MRYAIIAIFILMCSAAWGGGFGVSSEDGYYGFAQPVFPRYYKPVMVLKCEAAGDWFYSNTTPVQSDTYKTAGLVYKSLSLTKDAGAPTEMYLQSKTTGTYAITNTDLRTAAGTTPYVLIRYYIPTVADGTNIGAIEVAGTSDAWTGSFRAIVSLSGGALKRSVGWHTEITNPSNLTVSGSVDYSTIDVIRIKATSIGAGTTPTIIFDSVEFLSGLAKAKIALTFDDGKDEHYKIAAILNRYGLRGTFYIIPSKIGASGYLTLAQLREMQLDGHLIANHTYTHGGLAGGYEIPESGSSSAIKNDFVLASKWLYDNGFRRGARVVALPGGTAEWDGTLGAQVDFETQIAPYVSQCRYTGGIGSRLVYDPRKIGVTQPGATAANLATDLANAIADKGVAVEIFHGWTQDAGGSNYSEAEFKTHIANVATERDQGDIDVITMDELMDMN